MIYFISDTHFNHKNIIKYTERHKIYSCVDQMNRCLIENINSCVKKDDTLYHLGDFSMDRGIHWLEKVNKTLDEIKCKNIHLILGNHDPGINSDNLKKAKFKSIAQYFEHEYCGNKFCLSHYPMETWNKKTPIHLHGHCHGKNGFITKPYTDGFIRFDVSVDSPSMNYKPISIRQIIDFYNSQIT